MRKFFLFILFLGTLTNIVAQTSVKGVVKIATSGVPLSGVKVTIIQQNISTQTNDGGDFFMTYLKSGKVDVSFSKEGYFPKIVTASLIENKQTDIGTIELTADEQSEVKKEVVLQMSETEINDDESKVTQNVSGALSSKGDLYNSLTSFAFSPMRFRSRGYDQDYESTYINGVYFNGLERDNFNFSSLGGLNDAFRNQEEIYGLAPNTFSYGNMASTTNINVKASSYAHGSKASLAYTNRAYKLRGQYTYATGLMPNGWALTASAVVRWADKGIVEGTFYNSFGYFLSAEKIFNKQHSLSIVTFGAPNKRAQQSSATQEVYDLAGSIYYNSYWGYQNGKERNSRIVKSFDPTVILSHDFKINENKRLQTGLAYHYSLYSNSALVFYNARDPRPDYYRYLPSYSSDNITNAETLREAWQNNPTVSQINWDELYRANYSNNVTNPTECAKYAVERRHNNLAELTLNSVYTDQILKSMKLTAGIEGKMSKGMHYKTMDDLLGANQWIDIDQYAERDNPSNTIISQNDLNNPNRIIKVGDKFGYNYDLNIKHLNAFIQNEWTLPQLDIYYAAQLAYTDFYRYGHMLNGRAVQANAISYGKGKVWYALTPQFKGGLTYKIDGHNRFYVNGNYEQRSPQVDNSYISVRTKDTSVPMQIENLYSVDLNYSVNYNLIKARVSAFQTWVNNSSDLYGYYDDTQQTFVNLVLYGLNRTYKGIEMAMSIKLNSNFTLNLAGTYAEYKYTNNTIGYINFENGSKADYQDSIYTKGLKVATGPQMAGSISLKYFHPKMWFAELTLNGFGNNYLDFSPFRQSKTAESYYTSEEIKKELKYQEKLKGGFLLDASIGRVVYLKNRKSLNINLSANNILNNTKMITGGYQQARIPVDDGKINMSLLKVFGNKYYYAWGINMFLNVSFKF